MPQLHMLPLAVAVCCCRCHKFQHSGGMAWHAIAPQRVTWLQSRHVKVLSCCHAGTKNKNSDDWCYTPGNFEGAILLM